MSDKIISLLASNGYGEIAGRINDVKKIRPLNWVEDRYMVLGNDDNGWFTMIVCSHTIQEFRTYPDTNSRIYHANADIAEEYYTKA